MNHFGLIVEFEVPADKLDEFHRLLAVNAKASVAREPGCLQFDVLSDASDPTKVALYEIYETAEAFTAQHVPADHTKTFLNAADALGAKRTTRKFTRLLAPVKGQA